MSRLHVNLISQQTVQMIMVEDKGNKDWDEPHIYLHWNLPQNGGLKNLTSANEGGAWLVDRGSVLKLASLHGSSLQTLCEVSVFLGGMGAKLKGHLP